MEGCGNRVLDESLSSEGIQRPSPDHDFKRPRQITRKRRLTFDFPSYPLTFPLALIATDFVLLRPVSMLSFPHRYFLSRLNAEGVLLLKPLPRGAKREMKTLLN